MPDSSKDPPKLIVVNVFQWLWGYLLPGAGLILLGLVTAALSPASALSLGGFLCFFTLGISMIIEGTKRWRNSRKIKPVSETHK